MRQYPRFLCSLNERLPGLLGLAFPLKAAQQHFAGFHMLRTFRRSLGPVVQKHVCSLHGIGDEVSHAAVFPGMNRYALIPSANRHDADQLREGEVVPC